MTQFTNLPVNLTTIPQYQQVELTSINSKYKKVVVFNYFCIILLQILIGVGLYFTDLFFTLPLVCVVFGVIIITVLLAILNLKILKYRSYAFREHDIISQQGFIYKNQLVVPNNRIQHISINQGIYSKKLALCSLQIYTASTNNADIVIRGINYDLALQYKELILNKIKHDTDAE